MPEGLDVSTKTLFAVNRAWPWTSLAVRLSMNVRTPIAPAASETKRSAINGGAGDTRPNTPSMARTPGSSRAIHPHEVVLEMNTLVFSPPNGTLP